MKIVQIVESLERGGLERVVVDLSRGLQERGHEVEILCLFRGGMLVEEVQKHGIMVTVLEKRLGIDVKCMGNIRRFLKAAAPDVVHTHNAVCGYYPALAAWGLPGSVWINSRHGMGDVNVKSRKEMLYRLSLPRYRAVVAVCRAAQSAFVASGQVPAALARAVPNGIRVDRFRGPAASIRIRKRGEMGVPERTVVVGSVGRLNWAKNFPMLVRAFAAARAQVGGSARLLIVGEGPERGAVEDQIARSGLQAEVMLPGDRSDVADLLQTMDVFACSSLTEGYSIALLEASASGLPIVATNVGGNREIVQHGQTGLIAADGTEQELADDLVALMGDSLLRQRLGSAARDWAVRHASLDNMVDSYLAEYRR